MNRTLKRPMFRIGGSAGTGITSGLDQPRKQYAQGTNPYAMGNFAPGTGAGFLTSFGLDLLSRTPTGNIFQTAAMAAKDPFAKFQEQKQKENLIDMQAQGDQRSTVAALMKGINDDDKNKLFAEAKYMVEKGATNPFTNEPFKDINEAYDV